MPKSQKKNSVRFAPSPTGMLHIGNARTALINYLFTKKTDGKFLLRIEDTDKQRSSVEAVDVIFSGLKWLGLHYDGEAIFQSSRIERHQEVVYQLLAAGKAYKCYASADEIEKIRYDAQEDGTKVLYPDREHTRGESCIEGRDFVIRLKSPLVGNMVLHDSIQGEVSIDCNQLDDFVLLRSDGTPTYMLAVVVDDIDMNITHIIRGDDHFINAFRQAVLYEAIGAKAPQFAHIPLIHGTDGAKLSKRHGSLSVTDWQKLGYPAEVIVFYLASLGNSSFEDNQILSLTDMAKKFKLEKMSKAPARLDFDKISHLSGMFIRGLAGDILLKRLQQFLYETGQSGYTDAQMQQLALVVDLFKQRSSNFQELYEEMRFILTPDVHKDEQATALLASNENKQKTTDIAQRLESLADWTSEAIGACFKEYLSEKGLKMPALGPVLRAVIAGKTSTPDLPPIFVAIGKPDILKRLYR